MGNFGTFFGTFCRVLVPALIPELRPAPALQASPRPSQPRPGPYPALPSRARNGGKFRPMIRSSMEKDYWRTRTITEAEDQG